MNKFFLHKKASDDSAARTWSGIGGGVAGFIGADQLHRALARHTKYGDWGADQAIKAMRSKGLRRWGRVAGLAALGVAPSAIAAYYGSRGAKALYDKVKER